MKLSTSFLVFIVAIVSVGAESQETLSFKQSIELVKNNNSEIKAAESNLEANLYQVNSIRGLYYPQITANMGYTKSGPENPQGTSTNATYTASLNATQNIFNGFADEAKVEQTLAQAEIARSSLQITKARISFELKSAFANVLYSKETEVVALEFVKRRQQNLSMVELRYASGRENKGSLLLSQAYLQQAQTDLLKAKNRNLTSQSDLKKSLGLDHERELEIIDDLPLNVPSPIEPNYRNLILLLPNYAQSQAQIRLSEASLKNSKAGYYPNLNLTASTGKYSEDFFPDNNYWSMGINLSWPLFNGGRDYYGIQSTNASLRSATNNLYSMEREQLSILKKAFTAFVEAVEDIKVNEAFLIAAKSRAEIARAKYNNGLLTFDEWDIIENDLINRTKIYLLSKRDRILAEASWEQARGIGVIP